MMEKIQIMDAVERYLRQEMSAEERASFEQLRKTDPEVDQMVVEHSMFLQQLDTFGEFNQYKNTLNEVHHELVQQGAITEQAPRAAVRQLWKKYKMVMAVAASIAGITTLLIAGMVSY